MTTSSWKRSFRALLSVLFLDNLGLTIVYPIFTPLVLKPIYTLLPHQYPLTFRLILLGLLIASFPLGQFIAGPLIGHFADQRGRKLALTLALIGEGIGFTLTGLSIEMMSYTFLLISRFITGFFAGNLTLCLTAIADMTPDTKGRSKNFGIVSSVVGISFVVAIVIGGLSASIAWTNCLSLISIKAPSYLQGKLLGVNQSIATISMAFAPLFGGMVGEFDIRTIYLFASISLLISLFVLIIVKLKNRFN